MASPPALPPKRLRASLSKDIKQALTTSIAFLEGTVSGLIVPDEAGNQYKAAELILRTFAPNRMDLLELEMMEKACAIVEEHPDDWHMFMPRLYWDNKKVMAAVKLMQEETKLAQRERQMAEIELQGLMAKDITPPS